MKFLFVILIIIVVILVFIIFISLISYNNSSVVIPIPIPTPTPIPIPIPIPTPTPTPTPTTTPKTPKIPTPITTPKINEENWLYEHNKYRKRLNHPLLVWNKNLENQSSKYAALLKNTNIFKHGDYCNPICRGSKCNNHGFRCGQNLEKTFGYIPTPATVVNNWYNECKKYEGKPSEDSGHYTQLIWKNAKQVGCSIQGDISACLYDTGNILGEFGKNIPNKCLI